MTDHPAEGGLPADLPPSPVGDTSAVPVDVSRTGDARVDSVLAGLSELDNLELDGHPAHFAAAHDALRGVLASPTDEHPLEG